MTKRLTRTEAAGYLGVQDNFLILSHCRPDGDTIGTAALLCRGLRSLGKTAHILKNPEITEKYAHLHAGLTVDAPVGCETILTVDVAAPNMLPDKFRPLLERIALRIDHHATAASFTPLELVDPGAGACGEIVYDVLLEMGFRLDKAMAEALYTAVSTDTGCFRYANTTAHSLRTAADCAQAGGDLFAINQTLFDTNSFARLKVQSYLVEYARFYRDGAFAVCPLPRAVEQEAGATEDDLENISGFPRSIQGVKMAATLREAKDGQIKISVRAVPGYDAGAVCARFGGGGHKGAAGASLAMSLEEAALAVAEAMEALA